jgi:hypothetical protein
MLNFNSFKFMLLSILHKALMERKICLIRCIKLNYPNNIHNNQSYELIW